LKINFYLLVLEGYDFLCQKSNGFGISLAQMGCRKWKTIIRSANPTII
jgi:hypothetical protein